MGDKDNEHQKTKGTEKENGLLPRKNVLLHRSESLIQNLYFFYSGLDITLNLEIIGF